MRLRLLTPEKRTISRRISEAVASAGGRVEETRVKRKMRGMSETEIIVSYVHDVMRAAIVESLGQIPGVAFLGCELRSHGT